MYLIYPLGTLVDLTFLGLSAPLNLITCPVGLYVIVNLDSGTCHSSLTPKISIPHLI
ncbi:hypothetical protein D3C76_1422770 [compost metagenome]